MSSSQGVMEVRWLQVAWCLLLHLVMTPPSASKTALERGLLPLLLTDRRLGLKVDNIVMVASRSH